MSTLPTVKLPPLEWAAKNFATIMSQVDEAENLDEALIQAFADARLDVQTGVDYRQALSAHLKATMEGARAYRKQVDEYIQRLKRFEVKLKEDALKAVEALPGVELRGSSGKKLHTSSTTSLKLSFDIRESRTFTNVIDPDTASFLNIPEKYINRVSCLTLDTEAVKSDLKLGIKLDWARLETTRFVRGL